MKHGFIYFPRQLNMGSTMGSVGNLGAAGGAASGGGAAGAGGASAGGPSDRDWETYEAVFHDPWFSSKIAI